MVTYIIENEEQTVKCTPEMMGKLFDAVIEQFEGRARMQGYTGKKFLDLQAEFVMGAASMLQALVGKDCTDAQITPYVMFTILRGEKLKSKRNEKD